MAPERSFISTLGFTEVGIEPQAVRGSQGNTEAVKSRPRTAMQALVTHDWVSPMWLPATPMSTVGTHFIRLTEPSTTPSSPVQKEVWWGPEEQNRILFNVKISTCEAIL